MSYPDEIEQTFPENWPDELKDLAAPMTDVVLSPVHNVDEALSLLQWPDRRIGQFVQNRITSKAPMALIISPWRDIAPTSEFQLFYKGGRL